MIRYEKNPFDLERKKKFYYSWVCDQMAKLPFCQAVHNKTKVI